MCVASLPPNTTAMPLSPQKKKKGKLVGLEFVFRNPLLLS